MQYLDLIRTLLNEIEDQLSTQEVPPEIYLDLMLILSILNKYQQPETEDKPDPFATL